MKGEKGRKKQKGRIAEKEDEKEEAEKKEARRKSKRKRWKYTAVIYTFES